MSAAALDPRVRRGMERQLADRSERLARGERPLGWKVGFGAPDALRRFALDGPLVGFLTDRSLLPDGGTCSIDGWRAPVLEAEIAVHLERDVPAGADRAAVLDAIAGLGAAIELADVDPPPDDPEEILAADIYHRRVVLGPVDRGRRSTDGVAARVLRAGAEVARAEAPEALTGETIGVVRHVAEVLAACGERLRAGDVLIAGSVVPPVPLRRGEEMLVELPPLGSLAVALA